jgi:replication factor A1
LNVKSPSIIEHLAFLSVKYQVYLAELFNALVSARAAGNSTCEELTIEYRGTFGGQAVFLIMTNGKVVVQFRVEEDFLFRKDIIFDNWMNTDKIKSQIAKQKHVSGVSLIKDLRHGMKKVNVEADVLEASKPTLVYTQYGSSVLLTNALVADETGKIRLCLWGDHANSAAAGDRVQIKNASVFMYKRERQLRLGKTGIITVLSNANKTETQDKNTIYA